MGSSRQLPGRGRPAGNGQLLEEGVTAPLIANNLMAAIGALQAIKEAKLRAPADVAIVSIDDAPGRSLRALPLRPRPSLFGPWPAPPYSCCSNDNQEKGEATS